MSLGQSATSQLGWGFHTLRGGIDPGDMRLCPWVVVVVDVCKFYNAGMETYPPRDALALCTIPSQSAIDQLYLRSPVKQRLSTGAGVSTPCGVCSTRGITVFVPGLSQLYIHGGISDPGMGPCRPRVARAPTSQQSAGGVRVSTPCGAVSTRRITVFVPRLSEL